MIAMSTIGNLSGSNTAYRPLLGKLINWDLPEHDKVLNCTAMDGQDRRQLHGGH